MQQKKRYAPIEGEIFHVHTWRCDHAEMIEDSAYVEKAIELGASRIVFTDHCPFPGDPFTNRMKMEQLPEYISTMKNLRSTYGDKIEVLYGLETEYLPSFYEYYKELKESGEFDLLLLGQHFFEYDKTHYSFTDEDKSIWYIGQCNAMAEGMGTGFFDVLAHPDRVFREKKSFDEFARKSAENVIRTAISRDIYLEKNISSMKLARHFWPEFWDMLPEGAKTLYGFDAHSIEELEDFSPYIESEIQ